MSQEYKVNCVFKEKEEKNIITIDFNIVVNTMKDNEDAINFLFNFVKTFKSL